MPDSTATVRGGCWPGGVGLEEIAKECGTPSFIYNAGAIRARFHELSGALQSVPHRVCYAVKANANLAVLRVLRDLGAGADIVSGGELRRVLGGGIRSRHHRLQRRREDARGAR